MTGFCLWSLHTTALLDWLIGFNIFVEYFTFFLPVRLHNLGRNKLTSSPP